MREDKIEKEYNIVGKGVIPEEVEDTSHYLEGRKDDAMKLIEGEYIKTPEELNVVKHINQYLNEEFKELDIKEKAKILPDQIHLLPTNIYNRLPSISSKEKLRAFFYSPNQAAYIDKDDAKSRLALYKTMFHESVHVASFLKFRIKKEEGKVNQYRVGYSTGVEEHEHFTGLNEMVVDKLVHEMLRKHEKELLEEFKITPEESKQTIYYYPSNILDTIIGKIAEKNNEKEEVVWNQFKKGLFAGEMMHLREVERTFGKGSLRMLAALESGTKKDLEGGEDYRKILEYFQTDDEKEREQIAEDILVDREKEEYKKQKK